VSGARPLFTAEENRELALFADALREFLGLEKFRPDMTRPYRWTPKDDSDLSRFYVREIDWVEDGRVSGDPLGRWR
jgi:hypothetical protein